jgi:hypothetical protein
MSRNWSIKLSIINFQFLITQFLLIKAEEAKTMIKIFISTFLKDNTRPKGFEWITVLGDAEDPNLAHNIIPDKEIQSTAYGESSLVAALRRLQKQGWRIISVFPAPTKQGEERYAIIVEK